MSIEFPASLFRSTITKHLVPWLAIVTWRNMRKCSLSEAEAKVSAKHRGLGGAEPGLGGEGCLDLPGCLLAVWLPVPGCLPGLTRFFIWPSIPSSSPCCLEWLAPILLSWTLAPAAGLAPTQAGWLAAQDWARLAQTSVLGCTRVWQCL